ncbi:hypothetical protein DW074_10010, partial [Ruminococcus sp. AF46-10NS]
LFVSKLMPNHYLKDFPIILYSFIYKNYLFHEKSSYYPWFKNTSFNKSFLLSGYFQSAFG